MRVTKHFRNTMIKKYVLLYILILFPLSLSGQQQNPAELVNFSATLDPVISRVDIFWTFGFTDRFKGFNVQRKSATSPGWSTIDFIESGDCAVCLLVYTSADTILMKDVYYYRLELLSYNSGKRYSNEIRIDNGLDASFILNQNYPNPFNNRTNISYWLEKPAKVSLLIYNILGRQVFTLSAISDPGTHQFVWNGTNDSGVPLASGYYFYRLKIGTQLSPIRKLVLIK